jgi:hypothetical protein
MMKVNVLTINSKISLVVISFLAISFLSAAAQTPITVTTDKASYVDGDTITISGSVTDQLNIPISIVIRDSSHNPVYLAQTNPNSDGSYSAQAVAGGSTWKTAGTYEVDVTYGGADKTSKTTFEFTTSPSQPTGTANQTGTIPAVPEFGPLSVPIFAIAILSSVIVFAKVRPSFKI